MYQQALPFVLSNKTYGKQYCLNLTQNLYMPEVDAKPT